MEDEFDEKFDEEENIDTFPAKQGMPLNEMATNRQRAMIDTHPKWIELQEERRALRLVEEEIKAAKVAAKAQKDADREAKRINDIMNNIAPPAVRYTSCSTPGCESKTPSQGKKPLGWYKCSGKGCRIWSCGLAHCTHACKLH